MATSAKNLSNYSSQHLPDASKFSFGLVVSEWNEEITGKLLDGARETLLKEGVQQQNIHVVYVPGSFELALGAQHMLETSHSINAIICIGSVIQGETKHFDFVCSATAKGIMDVGLKYNKPVIFCVLTDNNLQQAIDRSGGKHGNKGTEAAVAAIKMAALQNRP